MFGAVAKVMCSGVSVCPGGYPAIQGPHPAIQGPHPDIFKVVHNEARASGWLASYWNAFLLFPPTNELYDGNVFTGVCLSTGVSIREISVKSGRYTSYWNAFLFSFCSVSVSYDI